MKVKIDGDDLTMIAECTEDKAAQRAIVKAIEDSKQPERWPYRHKGLTLTVSQVGSL